MIFGATIVQILLIYRNCVVIIVYTIISDLPTAPLAVNVTEVTYKSIQLEWSRPQPINGIISHYTITCLQADGTILSLNTTADGLETVSNLQPLTNYTCCISATNQAGEGNQTCVDARTMRGILIQCEQVIDLSIHTGPPTEPQEVAIVSAYTNGITLTWTEPAESYGQAILFYSINCTSAHHNAEIQRAYTTSVEVSGLNANTNYTCCVSAGNSVSVGLHQCIVVMTALGTGTICNALKGYYSYYSLYRTTTIWQHPSDSCVCWSTAGGVATSVYCDNMHNLLLLLQEKNEQTRSTKVIPIANFDPPVF